MEFADYLSAVRVESDRFVAAAAVVSSAAPVPTCPGWTVRDLLEHVVLLDRGIVWYLRTGHPRPPTDDDVRRWHQPPPADDEVVDWVRADLLTTYKELAGAPAGLRCWTFGPAASPLAFWTRRHAHEIAIHRVDLQRASGLEVTPVDPAFAADGIDELLAYLSSDAGPLGGGGRLDVAASDTGARWSVAVPVEGSAVLSGPVGRLYLDLWNRGVGGVRVGGDRQVLRAWREVARWTFG